MITKLIRCGFAAAMIYCSYTTAQAQTEKRQLPMADMQHPGVHDPVMTWGEDGRCYLFNTGNGIGCLSSADMKTWRHEAPVFKEAPAWATDMVKGYRGHTWAPDITHVNGTWYLYYSCSTFGSNTSAIGLATNKTLDPHSAEFKWEDQGLVIRSERGKDNWNAIDPNLIIDKKGNPWLTFGSFWDGIQLVRLDQDMHTPVGKPRTIARRRNPEAQRKHEGNSNAVEAPFIIYNEGYYYLFVSFDYCCRGLQSTYKTAVGRARNIQGPYRDKDGKKMLLGGGTVIAGPDKDYAGVGHCGVYSHEGAWWFVAHGYDKTRGGQSKLVLKPLHFTDGWPVLE